MRFKKIAALLIGGLMLLSMPLSGCDAMNEGSDDPGGGRLEDEDITVTGIDKEDHFTWFDPEKTDLPGLEECQKITAGMTLNQVIRKLGKPQRDIGYGTWIFQFDVDDSSVLTVTFVLAEEKEHPTTPTYDCLIVYGTTFDREIPNVYFPLQCTLNDLYPWINELHEEDVLKVRYELAYIGVAPGHLKDISYSTNSVDIKNTYRLLFSPLRAISTAEGQKSGGGYVQYDFFTANNETYSITVSNKTVLINNQYYKFVDNPYYAFQYSELDCHSFITYLDSYEIYTYANESIKVGDYDGLGEFEFQVYDGLIEQAPSYYLRGEVDLLILSENLFMIEGEANTSIYQITGDKNFSDLF